ncbi:transposase [Pollutibacter soli]|uniref:transposase n=1 Tax=Pollutibacter soli TaxID=3034157 RepID=UPI003013DC97
MRFRSRTVIRYSISFKQKVVNEIEQEGLSIGAAARRYGIGGGSTIQKWLQDFGKNQLLNKVIRVETRGEKDRLRELEEENRKLKIALAEKTMQKDVLETIIDLVNEHYQTDVKKNLGQKASKGSGRKKPGR